MYAGGLFIALHTRNFIKKRDADVLVTGLGFYFGLTPEDCLLFTEIKTLKQRDY
jgi:hypothetical protein